MINSKQSLEKRLNELLHTISDSTDQEQLNRALGYYLVLDRKYEIITGKSYNLIISKRRYKNGI